MAFVEAVAAQSSAGSRFTPELPAELEVDAASALAREAYVQAVRTVCKRVHAGVFELVEEEVTSWQARNGAVVTDAQRAIDAIGEVVLQRESAQRRQAYLTWVFRGAQSNANAEVAKYFGAATPSNSVAPHPDHCLKEASRLARRDADFQSTPEQTRALLVFAARKPQSTSGPK
jgi:hypothetical protein